MNRNRIIILISIVLLIILLAGVLIHLLLPSYLTQKIKEETTSILNKDIEGLYQVELDEVEISTFYTQLHIPSLRIFPRPAVLTENQPQDLPQSIFRLSLDEVAISTSGLIALARKKESINFQSLIIGQATLSVFQNDSSETDKEEAAKSSLESVEFDHLAFERINLQQTSYPDTTRVIFAADSVVFDGRLALKSLQDSATFSVALTDYQIESGMVKFHPLGQLNRIESTMISLNDTDSILTLAGLSLIPIYSKQEMGEYFSFQKDRVEAEIESLRISKLDVNQAINHGSLKTEQVKVAGGHIDIFRDRNFPLDTLARPLMPAQLIDTAPLQLFIATVYLDSLSMQYSELAKNSNEVGKVPFDHLRGTIKNITNIKEKLNSDSIMHIEAQALLFAQGQLEASFIYNLKDINGGFRAQGNLGTMEFAGINPALFPLTGARVISGIHKQSQFTFSGNDQKTTGELLMLYSDLELGMSEDQNRLQKGVISFLGRNFVYHPANPTEGNEARMATIEFERDPTRFVFHYWWQSYLSGIKDAVLRDYLK